MSSRIPAVLMGTALLLACDPGTDQERAASPDVVATVPAAAGDAVFVDQVPPDAQLLFVGTDEAMVPTDQPRAVFVPLSTFMVERDGVPNMFPPTDSMARMLEAVGVGEDRLVIVGDPIPAGRALAGLDYLGLGDRAALLDGGLGALGDPAGEVAAEAREQPGAMLPIDVREDIVVDADWVHARLDDPSYILMDARPPEQFTGEDPGGDVERPGHIPGARNLFWQTLVRSEDDTRLKPEAELRRMFEEAGVGPDRTIIAYCRTGGQSGFLYAVARHLGYEVRLYDGSFVDWSRTEYPVQTGEFGGDLEG